MSKINCSRVCVCASSSTFFSCSHIHPNSCIFMSFLFIFGFWILIDTRTRTQRACVYTTVIVVAEARQKKIHICIFNNVTNLCTQSRWSILNRVNNINVVDEDVKRHLFGQWNFTTTTATKMSKKSKIFAEFFLVCFVLISAKIEIFCRTRRKIQFVLTTSFEKQIINIDWLWLNVLNLVWLEQVEWTRHNDLDVIGACARCRSLDGVFEMQCV